MVAERRRKSGAGALDYAATNWEQNKQDAEIASTLAWVLYRNQKVEEADKLLQQVVGHRAVRSRYGLLRGEGRH